MSRSPFHSSPLGFSAAVAAFLIITSPISFASAAPGAADIADLVTKLDAPDLATRESATRALRLHVEGGLHADAAITPETQLTLLLEQFRTRELTLEQKTRLSLVARDLFIMTDRAGMGVSFAMEMGEDGVGIAGTVRQAGFYAHEVLKPGDVIRAADGIPVRSRAEMRAAVLSHDPGEVMELTLLRGGTIRKVNLKLGSFAKLDRPELPENSTLDRAWNLRLNREMAQRPAAAAHAQPADQPVIISQIDEDRWANLERGLSIARSKMVQDARASGLVLEPRRTLPWEGPPQSIAAGGQARRGKAFNLDGIDRGANAARFVGVSRPALLQRIDQANRSINQQMQFIDALVDQLNRPGIDVRTRMILQDQIVSVKATIQRIEDDITLMKQLIEER